MGLPPTTAPLTPGLNFATINAETLEAAQQEMEFKVPEEKVIDKARLLPCLSLGHCHCSSSATPHTYPQLCSTRMANLHHSSRAAEITTFVHDKLATLHCSHGAPAT